MLLLYDGFFSLPSCGNNFSFSLILIGKSHQIVTDKRCFDKITG